MGTARWEAGEIAIAAPADSPNAAPPMAIATAAANISDPVFRECEFIISSLIKIFTGSVAPPNHKAPRPGHAMDPASAVPRGQNHEIACRPDSKMLPQRCSLPLYRTRHPMTHPAAYGAIRVISGLVATAA